MKTFKSLLIGLVALGAASIATPAQADDGHRHRHHRGDHYYSRSYSHHHWRSHRPRVIYYGSPRYYRSYYYDSGPRYGYYRPYYRGPSVTIAFGGHRSWRHW